MTRPYLSHLTPQVRDPVSVIQPTPLLSTHIARGWVVRAGVDIRAGHQQDLRHLRMPTDRRHVKWGDLVLRGDRSGKEDMDKEKNEREKGYMCWSRDTDIYYNIPLEARATIQHANTQGLCACLGGGYMGPGPFYSHPTPHIRGPVFVIQPTLLSTHIGRGMGVCAGRQKSLFTTSPCPRTATW